MFSSTVRRALCVTGTIMTAALLAAGCGSDSDSDSKASESGSKSPMTGTLEDAPNEAPATSPQAVEPPVDDSTKTFKVAIANGQPKGGPKAWRVNKGDNVTISVSSDVADELHLHGYDVSKDVAAGGTATLEVVANTTGSFELELEDAATLVGNLEVR